MASTTDPPSALAAAGPWSPSTDSMLSSAPAPPAAANESAWPDEDYRGWASL